MIIVSCCGTTLVSAHTDRFHAQALSNELYNSSCHYQFLKLLVQNNVWMSRSEQLLIMSHLDPARTKMLEWGG